MGARIIGLVGFAGSGKDSVGRVWIDQLGFRQVSPSDGLYLEVSESFDVSIGFLQDRVTKEQASYMMALSRCQDKEFVRTVIDLEREKNPRLLWSVEMNKPRSPREILQLWGTEYRRVQDPLYWIKKMDESIQRLGEGPIVSTSIRFENEAKLIIDLGGLVVRVTRPGVFSINDHVSEKYAREGFCHFELNNDGTLDDLTAKAMSFLDTIGWGIHQQEEVSMSPPFHQSNSVNVIHEHS